MDEMRKQLLTLILSLILYPLAFYIEYRIIKHLIKFGIDYFFAKRYNYHEYKEAKEEFRDIENDLQKHQDT